MAQHWLIAANSASSGALELCRSRVESLEAAKKHSLSGTASDQAVLAALSCAVQLKFSWRCSELFWAVQSCSLLYWISCLCPCVGYAIGNGVLCGIIAEQQIVIALNQRHNTLEVEERAIDCSYPRSGRVQRRVRLYPRLCLSVLLSLCRTFHLLLTEVHNFSSFQCSIDSSIMWLKQTQRDLTHTWLTVALKLGLESLSMIVIIAFHWI